MLTKERRQAVESLLNRLAGVQSARVETTPEGELQKVHVVSTSRFSPDQQARNIESALLAALDLELEPGLISVVPLKPEQEPQELPAPSGESAERRVRLNQITYQQDRFKITAHVELDWQGGVVRGSSEDADTAKGRMMAAARATLDALESLTERRAAFFVDGLDTHQTFERTIAVASLRVISNVRKADLVGCAIVEEDPNYAAAQAVLGAVNRSFVRLLVNPRSTTTHGTPFSGSSIHGEARERLHVS